MVLYPLGDYEVSNSEIVGFERNSIRIRLNYQVFPKPNVSVIGELKIQMKTFDLHTAVATTYLNYRSIWTGLQDFPGSDRHHAVAFSINGKGYFGTGISEQSTPSTYTLLNDFWEYDPQMDNWTRIADFPGKARAGAVAFTIDNKGYVGTGSENFYNSKDTHLKDFYQYDPESNSWTRIADFGGAGRHSAVSFVLDKEGYAGLGRWGNDYPYGDVLLADDLWKYDAVENEWSEFTRFPTFTNYASAFTVAGKLYIYNYNTLFKLNQRIWETIISNNDGSWDHLAVTIEDKGYFGLGCPHQMLGSSTFVQYDPLTNKLTNCNMDYSHPRSGSSAFVIDDKAYIIGGNTYYNGIISLKDVWQFDPSKIK